MTPFHHRLWCRCGAGATAHRIRAVPKLPRLDHSCRWLREEGEGVDVPRPNHSKVAKVQCRDLGYAQTFRYCHEARIRSTEAEVGVGLDQLGYTSPILAGDRLDIQVAGGDGLVEGRLSLRAELTIDEPAGLRDHNRRCHQRSGMIFE